MNRLVIILLLGITIGSTVLGLAAAEADKRIVPHKPIMIELKAGPTEKVPMVETLKIDSLMTGIWERFPTPSSSPTGKEEFKQGEVMGIFLDFSYIWTPPEEGESWSGYWTSTIRGEDEYIWLNETLCAHFVATLALYDAEGNLVADSEHLRLSRGSGSANVTPQVTIEIAQQGYCPLVSYGWKPGIYTLKARVEELITGLADTAETAVTILVGPPPEKPHPISAHPRDLIVGQENLSEGWTIVSEDLDKETLEGYGMSIRYLRKAVGRFSKDVHVDIIQYANNELAAEYFKGRLEGALRSETYGHGKVTTLDVGDGGLVHDKADRRNLGWWDTSTSRASGSYIVFREENVIVLIGCTYEYEALKEGVYPTNEELMELAEIQAAKISAQPTGGE